MYQVKVTMRHPRSKQRVTWTGVFRPKGKNKTAKKEVIEKQCEKFCRENTGIDASFDRNDLIIKVVSTKIKSDFYIIEDEIK